MFINSIVIPNILLQPLQLHDKATMLEKYHPSVRLLVHTYLSPAYLQESQLRLRVLDRSYVQSRSINLVGSSWDRLNTVTVPVGGVLLESADAGL